MLFVSLVSGVLVINAALDLYFVYQENRRASIEVQREKAEAAAQRIESFAREIERQIGWVAPAQWGALPVEQRRFDYVRLLRQVRAITELVQLDGQGREQLSVSRLATHAVGAGTDRSTEVAFVGATANKVYFGPVHFWQRREPYFTMPVSHGACGGVTVAEVNLKLIRDVISQIKVGRDGYAYVADRLGWLVFVELPTAEAELPVINAGLRALVLLVLGLIIAALAGALLVRRMVVPIKVLQAGAQRIGSGELDHRLDIHTGDARRLAQVLLNLVGNAIKFTDSGSVGLRVEKVGKTFEMAVTGTGFGIAPADQAKIFEEFQQGDNWSTRKKGSAGLDLHGHAADPCSERRECGLRGFTPFSETAEPEDIMAVLAEYHGVVGPLIRKYEGTLDRVTGDGILVFFNDPLPCEDAPDRTARLAIEMRDAVASLAPRWLRRGHRLGLGIGMAQGYATLGRIGFEDRFDYTAIGAVINLAASLCAEASDVEDLGERQLCGMARPASVVRLHEVRAVSDFEVRGGG